ncbi:MAG: hypothetical protein ABL993_08365 [Vicinamibacterales bacterium]
MKHSHLSDDRLVEMSLAEGPSSAEQQHLGACPACEARRSGLAHMLGEVTQAAAEDADVAFPAERLAKQQVRIDQRIQQDGRRARVISFPGSRPTEEPVGGIHPASRWIAAAAVAGLVVGLVAGRLGPQEPSPYAASTQSARPAATSGTLSTVTAVMSDEELLSHIEVALDGRGGPALRPLDDLTPHAWESR